MKKITTKLNDYRADEIKKWRMAILVMKLISVHHPT